MTCASCVSTIEKSVRNLDGVHDVQVNLGTETAVLEYNESKVNLPKIQKTIASLGYKVVPDASNAKTDVQIGGMHCAACVATLEKSIGNITGVSAVTVNLAAENAIVQYDPRVASIGDIKHAIEGSGYQFIGVRGEGIIESEKEAVRQSLSEKKLRAITGILVGGILFVLMYLWPASDLRAYVMFAIATPAFAYTSFPIFRAMVSSLCNRSLNMDVMYGMGIGVAYGSSVAGTFLGPYVVVLASFMFYDSSVLLAGFLMFGRYLETRAKSHTSDAIKKLIGLQPKTAVVIRDGEEVTIQADAIEIGYTVVVKPGEMVPADGVVIEGSSYVDEAMITGEPIPVLKTVESKVVGGTINKNSVLHFSAKKVGKETVLAQIIQLVQDAQMTKPPVQKLADKAVTWFIPIVLAIAIGTFVAWLFVLGEWLVPLTRLITILVIACPCALGLATPTAVTVGIGRGAELGILIKNGEVLEKADRLTTFVFDKTGTLTEGRPAVTDVAIQNDMVQDQFLAEIAAVESNSQHPLAQAIVKYVQAAGIEIPQASDFDTAEGKGVIATVDGHAVIVGSQSYLEELGIDTDPIQAYASQLTADAKTVVHVAIDGRAAGVIGIADSIRAHSKDAIAELDRMGIWTMMITGDNERTANAIAGKIGITQVIAGVLPQDKAAEIQKLQAAGQVVAFTGDGINDAPALARADVGIAMGGGTDVAIESGEVVVMKDDPADAVAAIQLATKVLSRIKLNLFWAFAYNAVLIPIAIFGVVAPEWAGLAMAMSSVTVVSLSLWLKRFVPPIKKRLGPIAMPDIPAAPNEADKQAVPVLKCQKCGKEVPVPIHCDQPMHLEEVDGQPMLVCWMGPGCGKQEIPKHHCKPMDFIAPVTKVGPPNVSLSESSEMNINTEVENQIGVNETMPRKDIKTDAKGMDMKGKMAKAAPMASTQVLECEECGFQQPLPKHCGRDMQLDPETGEKLVCWMNVEMGEFCGETEIPQHHDRPMKIVDLA